MVAVPSGCDPNRIKLLLEDRLPGEGQTELERHLETCEECRRQLESLAGEAQWWRDARCFLDTDSHVAGGQAFLPVEPDRDSILDELPPGVLTPSDNPAMLGCLGPYEIVEPIGRGGMGIVLRGFDRELNRFVAIKVLAPHLATSAAARQRFAREAKAAAAVVHDHIVAIHAVDNAGRLPYLVMPYVAGQSLQERIEQAGALEVKEILRIAMQIAEGLAAAHAQGLAHRDVKPANILLENGVERVKITDFGLARAADDASLTHSGFVAGTPQYMAPEQARGEGVDARSDLFSLGSVVYAMCTGRAPFRAETMLAVLRRICEDTPRPVREVNPDIPDWLAEIVEKLHAKDREERFQSAEEVAKLLEQHLAHLQQPTVAPMPARLGYRSPAARRARRRILLRWAAGGLLLLVAGIGAAAAVHWTGWLDGTETAGGTGVSPVAVEATGKVPSPVRPTPREVDHLQEEIAQLREDVARLEDRWRSPAAGAAVPDPVPEIRAQVEQLEREMNARTP
jgi:serine/threonine-protein kinase